MKKLLFYIAGILLITVLPAFSKFYPHRHLKSGEISETKVALKTLEFSGITWQVRSGTGNPGGNYWSDSSESVWVDGEGTLHMKIRNINGEWYCSEIYSEESVGYGEYRFYVASDVENLNKNVVVGLFAYLNDQNEIDIEFSKWGNAAQENMGYYVTQPSSTAGNSENFALNLNGNYSTHRFIWEQNRINYKSWHGHDIISSDNKLIHEWNYTGKNIPVPGAEELIINLWLYQGKAPSDGKEVEVLIKAVEVNKPPVVNDLNIVIQEDTAVSSIIGNLVTPGYNSNQLTYSIADGNESGMFSVSDEGKIILEKAADYETANSKTVSVVVSKGDMTDTTSVTIHITNVNDNPPLIEGFSVSIPEDLSPGSKIGSLVFSDADGDSVTFQIVSGNENTQYSVTPDGEIILEQSLDFETNTLDSLTIRVSDGEFTANATVICFITNVVESKTNQFGKILQNIIYPNPATKILNVDFYSGYAVKFQIIGIDGEIYQVNEISRSNHSVKMNIEGLSPGTYLVLLKYNNRTETLKFTKQ